MRSWRFGSVWTTLRHEANQGGGKILSAGSAIDPQLLAGVQVRQSDRVSTFSKGCVFVHRHHMTEVIEHAENGDVGSVDGSDAASQPGFAVVGFHGAHLGSARGIKLKDEDGADGLCLFVHFASGCNRVAYMNVSWADGLHRWPLGALPLTTRGGWWLLHHARIGAEMYGVNIPRLGLHQEMIRSDFSDRAKDATRAGKEFAHPRSTLARARRILCLAGKWTPCDSGSGHRAWDQRQRKQQQGDWKCSLPTNQNFHISLRTVFMSRRRLCRKRYKRSRSRSDRLRAVSQREIDANSLRDRFARVRRRSMNLCAPLSAEDMMVQSLAEASPVKWHLAHSTWFFESFVLRPFLSEYRVFEEDFAWLFNSYYQSFSAFPDKRLRASFSRPSIAHVMAYREHVDSCVQRVFESGTAPIAAMERIELGVHHEEQHQELMLTDILHAFATNPLRPIYAPETLQDEETVAVPLRFVEFSGGLKEIGADGGFSFDSERPRHRVWLGPCRLASRMTTVEEYTEFIADGGYRRPELWLSAGWDRVQSEGWQAPLYWREQDGEWRIFSLRGEMSAKQIAATPVAHMSYYEADAFARWAGKRLATEAEWESAAEVVPVRGNLLESGRLRTAVSGSEGIAQLFGDCWQWTASAYLPYPGFKPLEGALGEYNGKFMSGLMILRGGSCATPAEHIRASYRNFFAPETRWQFAGIRLAEMIP